MNKQTNGGQWARKRTEKKEGKFRKKPQKNQGYHGYPSKNLCERLSYVDHPLVHHKNKAKRDIQTQCRNISYH